MAGRGTVAEEVRIKEHDGQSEKRWVENGGEQLSCFVSGVLSFFPKTA